MFFIDLICGNIFFDLEKSINLKLFFIELNEGLVRFKVYIKLDCLFLNGFLKNFIILYILVIVLVFKFVSFV